MKTTRRNFFRKAGLGAAAVAGMPLLAGRCSDESDPKNTSDVLPQGTVILFQGDSITDAGREKKKEWPNNSRSFGGGYANLAAARLLRDLPQKELTLYNRGISGNKVYQLADRWDKDCLMLKPDVLSILIGVNDYWHFRNGDYDGTPEIYENDFRALLERTKKRLPDVKLVICQPFILPDTAAVDETWLEPFKPYQEIALKMAGEFDAIWVPFQEAFDKAIEIAHPTYWTHDGVHPSVAGAQLMADTWLESLA